MKDALPNVAQKGHKFNVKEQTKIFNWNVQLSDANAQHDECLFEQTGISTKLTQSTTVPSKGGKCDKRKE